MSDSQNYIVTLREFDPAWGASERLGHCDSRGGSEYRGALARAVESGRVLVPNEEDAERLANRGEHDDFPLPEVIAKPPAELDVAISHGTLSHTRAVVNLDGLLELLGVEG